MGSGSPELEASLTLGHCIIPFLCTLVVQIGTMQCFYCPRKDVSLVPWDSLSSADQALLRDKYPDAGEGAVCEWSGWQSVRMGGSDNKGDGLASQPRRYRVPGQPLLNRHQVGGVSRSPDGLFAQQEWEPIRGRPAVRGKGAYGGRPGQRVEEGTWAAQKHSEAGDGRPVDRGVWTAKTVKRPRQQPAHPQYATYWAPLTRKRHTMPHPAQSQHANYWAPRTRKRHQQEHRPQRPTESSDPTQHAKGRTGDRPGPCKGATTRRNVTQGAVCEFCVRSARPSAFFSCRSSGNSSTGPQSVDSGLLVPAVDSVAVSGECEVAESSTSAKESGAQTQSHCGLSLLEKSLCICFCVPLFSLCICGLGAVPKECALVVVHLFVIFLGDPGHKRARISKMSLYQFTPLGYSGSAQSSRAHAKKSAGQCCV